MSVVKARKGPTLFRVPGGLGFRLGRVGVLIVVRPVHETLAVGAAHDVVAALQINEDLRRDGNVAAGADARFHRHDDGVTQAVADELVAAEHGRGNEGAHFRALNFQSFQKLRKQDILRNITFLNMTLILLQAQNHLLIYLKKPLQYAMSLKKFQTGLWAKF